jgi:glyceraldehyde-3-phosphate dehydrogenase [NAD(P)+]
VSSNGPLDERRLFIDGERRDGSGTIEVRDLARGASFGVVSAASEDEARGALAAAHRAKEPMRETTVVERANWLEDIAEAIERESDRLAETIVREAGKPISSARGEVGLAAERFRRAAAEVRDRTGEFREGSTKSHEGWRALVKYEPRGIVLCVGPYNYPLSTVGYQVAPALAAGNSVVLKPSSKTPISGGLLTELIHEAVDLPDGALNYVPGRGSEIGDVLAGDDRVNAIAMTGSSSAGKRIARQSGIVELHLELGGNAPAIIFPDADLVAAADACTAGSLKFAGQRCSAVSRVLAHESVHDEVVERIDAAMEGWEPGDLFEESTTLGPLIDESQAEWVEGLVEDALESGATLVRGGERDGVFFEPTLLADVPRDARIVHEEQFGPVAAVTTFADEAEALSIANGGEYALDASVFTTDHDRALRVAERVDAGAVRINGAPSHGLGDVPFGGNKASGIGREGIGTTIEAFSRKKSIIL